MADRVDVYAQSLLEIVVAEGHLDEVEDELFRFARIVEGNDELRMTLANPGMPLDRRAAIAAQGREHAVAEVRSAVALDDTQRQRISEALSRATRKQVEVKVIVDESVMGGIVATIGDTVIDGTVRHRLDQLKEQI
jgi:F-type H+-transporting ATPase subunit delta